MPKESDGQAGVGITSGQTPINKPNYGVKNVSKLTNTRQDIGRSNRDTGGSGPRWRRPFRTHKQIRRVGRKLDNKDDTYHQTHSKLLSKGAWVVIRAVAFVLTPIQFISGVVTFISVGLWIYAEEWTLGFSNFVLPNDIVTTVSFGIALVSGLLILFTAVFSFWAIARLPVFTTPTTFGWMVVAVIICACPLTCFVPGGLIYCLVVALKFKSSPLKIVK